ncbi:MAG: hypothetical protein K0U84_04730, partial [Actinomycetia bacterium]|nr:hypothetical protein [Actinomycetes bacterium]
MTHGSFGLVISPGTLTADGPYLRGQVVLSTSSAQDAAAVVTDTLAQQIPLIDTFEPTPVDKLAELPRDPDGLLARTQLPPPDQTNLVNDRYYGPRGQLAFDSQPAVTQELFAATGTDLVAQSGTQVYRTRDSDAATKLLEGFSKDAVSRGFTPADSPAGLPDAQCKRSLVEPNSALPARFYCLLTADRYLIEAQSRQLEALHQLISAQ